MAYSIGRYVVPEPGDDEYDGYASALSEYAEYAPTLAEMEAEGRRIMAGARQLSNSWMPAARAEAAASIAAARAKYGS